VKKMKNLPVKNDFAIGVNLWATPLKLKKYLLQ
jgi:hypothetical protein